MEIHVFTFNPFEENTYVIASEGTDCTIIDPGSSSDEEFSLLNRHLKERNLEPTKIVLTHAHIDHVLGLARCLEYFNLLYYMHDLELPILSALEQVSQLYSIPCRPVTQKHKSLQAGESIRMGGQNWKILFTPGHSPGSLCFYEIESGQIIGGDVLFRDSIGRTDLPGGHHETLLSSIRDELFTLVDEVRVYPGHGPATTIGYEKQYNPFLRPN